MSEFVVEIPTSTLTLPPITCNSISIGGHGPFLIGFSSMKEAWEQLKDTNLEIYLWWKQIPPNWEHVWIVI